MTKRKSVPIHDMTDAMLDEEINVLQFRLSLLWREQQNRRMDAKAVEQLKAMRRHPLYLGPLTQDEMQRDQDEFIEENSLGGKTYHER